MTMLELHAIDVRQRPQGLVLINVADVESIRRAVGTGRDYGVTIGSIVRTRSGDEHIVNETVGAVKKILQHAAEGENQ